MRAYLGVRFCNPIVLHKSDCTPEPDTIVIVAPKNSDYSIPKLDHTFEKDVSFAYDQIDPGAIQPQSAVKAPHDRLAIEDFVSPVNGYVVVYLSNESDVFTEVYFDDLRITVNEHPVVQRDDYYPFGLQHDGGFNRVTSLKNDFLFIGKERIDDLDLSWYDFGARVYDPSLGRWFNIDAKAEILPHWTPYRYGFNNPMRFSDPDGNTEEERIQAVNRAREYVGRNPNQSSALYGYAGWRMEVPGCPVDCSGLVNDAGRVAGIGYLNTEIRRRI